MRKSEKRKMIPNVFNNFNKSVSVFGELNKIWSFLGRGYCRSCAKRKRFDIKWLRCHYFQKQFDSTFIQSTEHYFCTSKGNFFWIYLQIDTAPRITDQLFKSNLTFCVVFVCVFLCRLTRVAFNTSTPTLRINLKEHSI
jgi:hypothetical protein